jgi:hypothetical protein
MLTPPYHFAIAACPLAPPSQHDEPHSILYRGSIPLARNLPFLRRLGLRTIICMRKKPLAEDDVLVRWGKRHNVTVKWIKADPMSEEHLGMGRTEVGEVLKVGRTLSQH